MQLSLWILIIGCIATARADDYSYFFGVAPSPYGPWESFYFVDYTTGENQTIQSLPQQLGLGTFGPNVITQDVAAKRIWMVLSTGQSSTKINSTLLWLATDNYNMDYFPLKLNTLVEFLMADPADSSLYIIYRVGPQQSALGQVFSETGKVLQLYTFPQGGSILTATLDYCQRNFYLYYKGPSNTSGIQVISLSSFKLVSTYVTAEPFYGMAYDNLHKRVYATGQDTTGRKSFKMTYISYANNGIVINQSFKDQNSYYKGIQPISSIAPEKGLYFQVLKGRLGPSLVSWDLNTGVVHNQPLISNKYYALIHPQTSQQC